MLAEGDPERSYVHFTPSDETVLLISNFGGMSPLEVGALVDEVLHQLERDYKLTPVRVYQGPVETSLNAPAFSISVMNLTDAAKNCSFSVAQMKEFLDVRTTTNWESFAGAQTVQKPRKEQFIPAAKHEPERTVDPAKDLRVDPKLLTSMVKSACDAIIAAEPDLTKWDTIMGDGDCGETLKTGATSMLSALDSGLAEEGSVVRVMHELEYVVESKMGGTLGGILGIFFVSMTNTLSANVGAMKDKPTQLWATSIAKALSSLQRYTPAKVGDRTVMDVFIPFADAMGKTSSFEQSVKAAVDAAEGTKKMTPRLGRATYVGQMEGKDMPPDPGAWGAMEGIRGLLKGM